MAGPLRGAGRSQWWSWRSWRSGRCSSSSTSWWPPTTSTTVRQRCNRRGRVSPPTAVLSGAPRGVPRRGGLEFQRRARAAVLPAALAGRRPPGCGAPAALGAGPVGSGRAGRPNGHHDGPTVPVAAPPPPRSGARPGRGAAAARLAGGEHAPGAGRGRPGPGPGPDRPSGPRAQHLPQRPDPDHGPPWPGPRTPPSSAATILQGPGTYLLVAGNNAEMRSGSGAFLEAGIVTTAAGELHLSEHGPHARR